MKAPKEAVRIDADLHARLKVAAEERGMSMGALAGRLLEQAMADLIPVDELLRRRGQ